MTKNGPSSPRQMLTFGNGDGGKGARLDNSTKGEVTSGLPGENNRVNRLSTGVHSAASLHSGSNDDGIDV